MYSERLATSLRHFCLSQLLWPCVCEVFKFYMKFVRDSQI